MIALEQIRAKIVGAIRQSGLTQSELARRLGIVQQTISEYLRGRSMPALDTLANLCEVLDLDANAVLCIHEYAVPKKTVTVNNSFNNNTGKIDLKI